MPFNIVPVKGGFKVSDDKGKTFSEKPLTKKVARSQQIAIALSESKTSGKPISDLFGHIYKAGKTFDPKKVNFIA